MGKKGDTTKLRIAEASAKLFATYGFGKVTMKDICDATELSRGGLYRYFSSTTEIFEFLLTAINERHNASIEEALDQKVPIRLIFDTFLRSRMRTLHNPEQNIELAFHEFASLSEKNRQILADYIDEAVSILTRLITLGCEEGTYDCDDPQACAQYIFWLLSGMNLHNSIVPLSEDAINKQSARIYRALGQKQI